MIKFLIEYICTFKIHWCFKEVLSLIIFFLLLRKVSSLFLRSLLYVQKRRTKWICLYITLKKWKPLDFCLLILGTILLLLPHQVFYRDPTKIFFFCFFPVLRFFTFDLAHSKYFILGYTFLFILNIGFIQYQHFILQRLFSNPRNVLTALKFIRLSGMKLDDKNQTPEKIGAFISAILVFFVFTELLVRLKV